MGLINRLRFPGTCPHCGHEGMMFAEFYMGMLNGRFYEMGEQLDWSGPPQKYDRPETGYFADYGFAYHRECDGVWWVWLTLEGNAIVRVEPSEGPTPFINEPE